VNPESVTLRPQGCARVIVVPFLLAWLAGWAVGELFAINMLLAFFGSSYRVFFPLPIPAFPFAAPSLLPIGFLLLWGFFWTWGGLTAMGTFLRLLFGSDVVDISPQGLRLTRSYGLFRFTRDFAGWRPELRRKDRALLVRRDRKTKVLSNLGTPEERTWVRDEFERRYPRPRTPQIELPRDYEAHREMDGSTLIQRNLRARRGAIGCGVFALLIWNLPFGIWVYYRMSSGQPVGSGTAVPVAFSVLTFALALWCFFARQTWHVKRNYLEERLEIFGVGRRWQFTDANLEIDYSKDSDGDESFTLYVKHNSGRKLRLYSAMHDPEETIALARFLKGQTGWNLIEPRELTSP
jgi:hypothetical protein